MINSLKWNRTAGTPSNRTCIFEAVLLIMMMMVGTARSIASETPPLWGELKIGHHSVGFRLIQTQDESRPYPSEAREDKPDSPHNRARPLRMYVWYPAEVAESASTFSFDVYASMAHLDFAPAHGGAALEEAFHRDLPIRAALGEEAWERLLRTLTGAHLDATPADGNFPVIIFGQGWYYESPISHTVLCEYLASHGYIVATCPLTGTHSPIVRLTRVDLETQVRDLEFVRARTLSLPGASDERLGVVGFDMGGMSGLVLTMRNNDVDAFVSLDAGILYGHPSGLPRASPHYDVDRLCVPWLHMTRTEAMLDLTPDQDPRTLFQQASHADRYLFFMNDMRHVDFTSYAMYGAETPLRGYWPPPPGRPEVSYAYVCRLVHRFFDAQLKGDASTRRLWDAMRASDQSTPAQIRSFVKLRESAPFSWDDFVRAIFSRGPEEAIQTARDELTLAQRFTEVALNELGYQLLYFWGRTEAAIAVFELNTEWYPESFNVHDSLGEAHMAVGARELAIKHYRRSLSINPENENAATMLQRLGEQP